MPRPVSQLVPESDYPTEGLRRRLDEFYGTVTTYDNFLHVSHHPAAWEHVAAESERLRPGNAGMTVGPCRILELGAGRTGFGTWSRRRLGKDSVHFTAQDVTAQNADHLRAEADAVHLGPVQTLSGAGAFDLIFSTFVFEHVTDPRATLEHCFQLLRPGGSLFLFCPRYDFPFYLSPSASHLGRADRLVLGLRTLAARAGTLLRGRPAFLIHHDPAVFTLGFARDRDAVHWVSRFDLAAWGRGRAELTDLPMPAGRGKDWVVKNLLQVRLRIRRPIPAGAAPPP